MESEDVREGIRKFVEETMGGEGKQQGNQGDLGTSAVGAQENIRRHQNRGGEIPR